MWIQWISFLSVESRMMNVESRKMLLTIWEDTVIMLNKSRAIYKKLPLFFFIYIVIYFSSGNLVLRMYFYMRMTIFAMDL